MSSELVKEAIKETERLMSLSQEDRKLEGVYATNSQLSMLIKKLRGAANRPMPALSGITKFVADFSGMNSKLLDLVDQIEES